MLQLPIELRRLCVGILGDDGESLKALRLTNQDLGTLAAEILFRKAILSHTEKCVDKYIKLKQSSLNSMVHHVIINTSNDPRHSGSRMEASKVMMSFGEAIASMSDFLNLEEVDVKFARECGTDLDNNKRVAETNDFRVQVWNLVLTALRDTEKVRSLTIKNLQDYHDDRTFLREDFVAVRDRLAKLHLEITNEYNEAAPEDTVNFKALHDAFTHSLPEIWLKPLTQQLTHLTVYGAECLWGVWPFVDFREIPPFPHLRSLSLGNFIVAHDWQIDWVTMHSATLEQLLLDDCSIVMALKLNRQQAKLNFPDEAPFTSPWNSHNDISDYLVHVSLRWHDIFDRLRTGLPQLHHFAMGHGNWDGGEAFEQRYEIANRIMSERYCIFDWRIGPSQWVMNDNWQSHGYAFHMGRDDPEVVLWPRCEEEDRAALAELVEVMEARLGTRA